MIFSICNLCGMELPHDSDIIIREDIHIRWHKNCKKEKRNTTEGIVMYDLINDSIHEMLY